MLEFVFVRDVWPCTVAIIVVTVSVISARRVGPWSGKSRHGSGGVLVIDMTLRLSQLVFQDGFDQ